MRLDLALNCFFRILSPNPKEYIRQGDSVRCVPHYSKVCEVALKFAQLMDDPYAAVRFRNEIDGYAPQFMKPMKNYDPGTVEELKKHPSYRFMFFPEYRTLTLRDGKRVRLACSLGDIEEALIETDLDEPAYLPGYPAVPAKKLRLVLERLNAEISSYVSGTLSKAASTSNPQPGVHLVQEELIAQIEQILSPADAATYRKRLEEAGLSEEEVTTGEKEPPSGE